MKLATWIGGSPADRLQAVGAALARSGLAKGGRIPGLALELPDGQRVRLGGSPAVALRIRDAEVVGALARPTFAKLAEAYVQGRIDIDGSLLDALPALDRIVQSVGSPTSVRGRLVRGMHSAHDDRAAIGFHYDVGNDFYRLWLDSRMVYSCAYFEKEDDSLEQAQRAKLDHICRKLRLGPGDRLLDIGCGWGGLAIHAAQEYGARVTGITLSESQLAWGRERVQRLQLANRCALMLLDYRELPARFGPGAFDKVASIGMFEHVGLRRLPEYFGAVAAVLRDRGLFLNHGITSADVDSRPVGSGVGEFIDRYVFPQGELPHLHLATREMAAAGFEVCDVEGLRPHYARTLEHWSSRLDRELAAAQRLVPPKTLRVWRAYLAGCAYGFAQGWVAIYQLLASRQATPGPTELPLTRAWLYR